ECLLGFRERFGERVAERVVDRDRRRGRLVRILDLLDEESHRVTTARIELLHEFVQIVVLEEELRLVGRGFRAVVDAAQRERPRPRIDRALKRNLVADLPAVLLRELAAGDRPRAISEKRLALLGAEPVLGIDVEKRGAADRELREEVALADVDAA